MEGIIYNIILPVIAVMVFQYLVKKAIEFWKKNKASADILEIVDLENKWISEIDETVDQENIRHKKVLNKLKHLKNLISIDKRNDLKNNGHEK